jgi:TatD DNase family protein
MDERLRDVTSNPPATARMSLYVDTHCHLDLFRDPGKALDDAPRTVVVLATELPSRYRLLAVRFRGNRQVRVALGLHPLRAATASALEVSQFVRQLPSAEYVGEVGLDFSAHGRDTKTEQLKVFNRILAQPDIHHKVITVHSRGAEAVVIERLKATGIAAILHWYTGPKRLVNEALTGGLYFSINPAMLRTEKGRALILALPRDRVLTESDGPFAKAYGHMAGPADIPTTVSDIAGLWGTDPSDVRRQIYDNMTRLYAATVGSKRCLPESSDVP